MIQFNGMFATVDSQQMITVWDESNKYTFSILDVPSFRQALRKAMDDQKVANEPKPTAAQLKILVAIDGPYEVNRMVTNGPHPSDAFRSSVLKVCIEKGWVEQFWYRSYLLHGAVRLTEAGKKIVEGRDEHE